MRDYQSIACWPWRNLEEYADHQIKQWHIDRVLREEREKKAIQAQKGEKIDGS